ncbi:MAG: hypothetical protein KF862_26365 [Chitinophagaceae bacterium]|nr:hypothetical protein [Chitinophagaceae bacterium]
MAGISSKALNNTPENRKKFNGIEHTTEFDLNTYDAFFRNADPQIGRWWQTDPKPNMAESPYAMMGNNPILNIDPLGDTATVRWRTGFLGIFGSRREARYVDGQWIDSKSRAAVAMKTVERKGAARVMNDYNKLNGIEDFSPVTSAINKASNDVRIGWGSSETNAPKYFKDLAKGISNPTISVSAGSSANLPGQVMEDGKSSKLPSHIVLGHELGHVYNLLTSGGKRDDFYQIKGLEKGISNSEVNAMYWENVLRINEGMPLRLWYHYDRSANIQYQQAADVSTSGIMTTIMDLNKVNLLMRLNGL